MFDVLYQILLKKKKKHADFNIFYLVAYKTSERKYQGGCAIWCPQGVENLSRTEAGAWVGQHGHLDRNTARFLRREQWGRGDRGRRGGT